MSAVVEFPWPPEWLLSQFNHQREMRDLLAQEAMADWAFWMMVLTAMTAAISVMSIYFLFRTFRQTTEALHEARMTAAHAKEAAFTENRPWIMIFGPSFSFVVKEVTADEVKLSLAGTFSIKNDGKMPAVNVEYDLILTQDQEVINAECSRSPENGKGGKIILPPSYDSTFTIYDTHFVIKRGEHQPDTRLIQLLVRVSYGSVNAPLRVLTTVGQGCIAEAANGGGDSFQPIVYEKIEAYGLSTSAVYAYSIKCMI